MRVLEMVGMRIRCHRAARQLQAYLDGEADATAAAMVAAHLEECRRCGLEASTYTAIKAAVALRQDADHTAAVDPAVLARLGQFARELSTDGLGDPAVHTGTHDQDATEHDATGLDATGHDATGHDAPDDGSGAR